MMLLAGECLSEDGKWYNWHDLCKGEDLAAELFGDQLGEWKATKF